MSQTTNNTLNNVSNLQSEETNLKREIGLFSGANVLMGIMIGSGIFYLGSYVLMRSGMSMGLALLVWIIGGIVTMLSGLCYAELGAMMPKAGGRYIYLREAYGQGTAFVSGLSGFILGSCGSTAAIAIALPTALNNFIPMTTMQHKIFAITCVIILTYVNIIGVKQGASVQNIFTVGKLVPIGIILFAGIFLGNEMPNLMTAPVNADGSAVSITSIIGMVAFATVATLWAYEGWTNLNVISEEIKNPKKNIPMAIIVAVAFVTVLYTLFNFAIYRVVPAERVAELIELGNYYLGTEAATILFGSAGGILVAACMALSIFGSLNGCVLVFPRSALAMGRDGMLPRSLANVHPKYKTPHNALIVHMIISCLLIMSNDLNSLTSLVTFSAMIFNTMAFCSVLTLRKKYPDIERPYRVATWMVYLTVAIMVGLMINTFIESSSTAITSLVVVAAVYVLYMFIGKRNANNTNNI